VWLWIAKREFKVYPKLVLVIEIQQNLGERERKPNEDLRILIILINFTPNKLNKK